MSRVTVFQGNIDRFVQRNALSFGGTTVKGIGRRADRVGDRMVAEARSNARTRFNRRTGELENSVVKIHRVSPGGGITVGVGTTVEHGAYLENGTQPHTIARQSAAYLLKSGGPRDRPPGYQNPRPLYGAKSVRHPGSKKGMGWLRDAVRTVRLRGV
jgi:hypothetical protein